MKKYLKNIFLVFSIVIVVSSIGLVSYIGWLVHDMDDPIIEKLQNPVYSKIYDDSNRVIEELGENKIFHVEFDEIPDILINAIISIEDNRFFSHQGVDYNRTIKAFLHNFFNKTTYGGSTITQQLIKNVLLTDEQSYQRKIKEAYLAQKLERALTKEEIFTHYCNRVYFEQSVPGAGYASKRYFGKDLQLITLPEAAVLAAAVKSASYYNPFKYPERISERKNLVLRRMYELNYIDLVEYEVAKATKVSDIVIEQGSQYHESAYRFQSYLDVVYKEVGELTDLSPYTVPLEINTYLDSSIQTHFDDIQENKVIEITDPDQQLGACLIENDNGAIRGVIGGRNYHGSRIFNRSYDLRRQPASTIKPVFSYLLAAEHLQYNGASTVSDEPYTYPGTNITVKNADNTYLGNISLTDAIGYSKNTSALSTLEKVNAKIGNNKLIEHLENIGLWDGGPFSFAYGIGGMTYGVSPTMMAGAYATLMRQGNYLKPSTIKQIRNLETNEIIYQRETIGRQIVKNENAFQIANTLVEVVKQNYYNIGAVGVKNVQIGAKTGTNAFDKNLALRLGYPESADKDSWIVGFSPDYTCAVWSGFDVSETGKPHYFGVNDGRRKLPKTVFQNIMEEVSRTNIKISVPDTLTKTTVVKGADGVYLPNELITNQFKMDAYFPKNNIPAIVLPLPLYPTIHDIHSFFFVSELQITLEADILVKEPFDYSRLFGARGYYVKSVGLFETKEFFFEVDKFEIPYDEYLLEVTITPGYKNSTTAKGETYKLSW